MLDLEQTDQQQDDTDILWQNRRSFEVAALGRIRAPADLTVFSLYRKYRIRLSVT